MISPEQVLRRAAQVHEMRSRVVFATGGIFLCGIAGALVACDDGVGPLPREGIPEALEFSIGSFATGSSRWELQEDTLLFLSIPPDVNTVGIDTVRRVPAPEEWTAFWATVREAGVWNWNGRYEAEGVVDGTGWSLRLSAQDVSVDAEGINAYPDRQGEEHENEVTDAFRAFRQALEDLAGEVP